MFADRLCAQNFSVTQNTDKPHRRKKKNQRKAAVLAKIEVEKQLQFIWQKPLLNIQKDHCSFLLTELPSF